MNITVYSRFPRDLPKFYYEMGLNIIILRCGEKEFPFFNKDQGMELLHDSILVMIANNCSAQLLAEGISCVFQLEIPGQFEVIKWLLEDATQADRGDLYQQISLTADEPEYFYYRYSAKGKKKRQETRRKKSVLLRLVELVNSETITLVQAANIMKSFCEDLD